MGPTLAQNQNRRTARVSEDDRLRKAIARNRAKQARKPLPTNSRLNTRKLGATALPNSAPTRLSVGRVGHTTMTSSASPATNRAPSMISYGQQTKDTWKDKFYKYGYYSLWIFCLFLLVKSQLSFPNPARLLNNLFIADILYNNLIYFFY